MLPARSLNSAHVSRRASASPGEPVSGHSPARFAETVKVMQIHALGAELWPLGSNRETIVLPRFQAAISRAAALLTCLAASTFSVPAAAQSQWLQRGYDAAAAYANT